MHRFAFAFAFALVACGPEQPVEIQESPTVGVCDPSDCLKITWTAGGADGATTCCDCRRARAGFEDFCNDTFQGDFTIRDDAAAQCSECNELP